MTLQMAPGKSIGYSRFYNRYKMVVIIEMWSNFYFMHHKSLSEDLECIEFPENHKYRRVGSLYHG